MQPYIFPFIGYFHLIEASDKFIFYDDVQYIKKGWINRNRILLNGKSFVFTVPLSKGSQNKLINEIHPIIEKRWKSGFFKTIEYGYSKSPNYREVMPLIHEVLNKEYSDITDLCIESIKSVLGYLRMNFNYIKSSVLSPESKGMKKADRLIEITKKCGASEYVNAIGGKSLYEKRYFEERGVRLHFVESRFKEYRQLKHDFVAGLSILDILMFNDRARIREYLNDYELV